MEKGGKAQRETPPPPQQPSASCRACVVLASCLRHACNEGKTTWAPLPPPHRGGGRKAAPPPRTTRQGREVAVRGCGTDHTTVPVEGTRRVSPSGGTTGGASAG